MGKEIMGLFSKIFDFVGDVFNEVVSWFVDIPEPPQYEDEYRGALVNKQSNLAPILVIYGQRKIGGTRVFVETSGSDNEYVYICLALCEGEVQGVTQVYVNDESVWTGNSSHGSQYTGSGKYSSNTTFQIFHGTDDQTASSLLQEAASWSSTHRLRGVAYIGIRFKWDKDVFSSLPEVTAVVKGRKVYDPRTTATGYSTNPALCLLDYLRNSRYGKGLPDAAFESGFTSWQAAANDCESSVTEYTGGSSINIFDCNMVLDVSKNIIDNTKEFLSGMYGLLTYTQGVYKLVIEGTGSATYAFTEDNILGGITINGERKRERFNRVIATFANPDKNWQQDQVEYPAAGSSEYTTLLAEDGGFELEKRAALPTITNQYQAKNIAQTILYKSRNGIRCSFLATIDSLQVEVGDIVSVTHSSPGWSAKPFRVTGLSLQGDGNVGVTLTEHQNSSYVWLEGAQVPDYPDTTLPDPFAVSTPSNLTVASGENYQGTNDNGSTFPRMYVSWTNAADNFVDYYTVQTRTGFCEDQTYTTSESCTTAGGTWDATNSRCLFSSYITQSTCTTAGHDWTHNDWSMSVDIDKSSSASTAVYLSGIESGREYDVRVRGTNALGVSSVWVQLDNHVVAALVGGAIGGVTTFSQTTAPSGDLEEGDIWFDTDDNNKMYRWNGSSWVAQSGNLIGTTVTTGLSDISTNFGIITAGKMQNAAATFVIDLDNKYIYIE
jgi:hypothetical protein